jgi:hypothetical protein
MKLIEYNPKKLRSVKNQHVKHLGEELNMRFQLKRKVLMIVIEQYLFDDDNKKSG